MTTIALHFRKGVGTVAADGRETDSEGHICTDLATKILHTEIGDVMACCGDVDVIETVVNYWGHPDFVKEMTERLRTDKGMSCFYYDKQLGTWNLYGIGITEMGEAYEYQQEITYNYAIGNGAQYAISAMDFGCDAVGAIEHAATRDTATGGRIEQWSPATELKEPVDAAVLPDHMG